MKTSFPEFELATSRLRTPSQVTHIRSRSIGSESVATIRHYCCGSGLPIEEACRQ